MLIHCRDLQNQLQFISSFCRLTYTAVLVRPQFYYNKTMVAVPWASYKGILYLFVTNKNFISGLNKLKA